MESSRCRVKRRTRNTRETGHPLSARMLASQASARATAG